MGATILLCTGTTPGAVGMDVLRRRQWEIDRCRQRLKHHTSALLEQRLASLEHDLQLLAIDVDGTQTYTCHLPLNSPIHRWHPDQFIHCGMPDADVLCSIEAGRQRGEFENVNPQAVRALKAGVHASGGTRTNGYTALKVNRDAIEERLRRCFQATRLERSHERGEDPVRVILVASTFGGFASGSLIPLEQLVLEVADSMKIAIAFTCILLIPGGTNSSKDLRNSRAVTIAVMKERVAISSEQHVHRQRVPGHSRRQAVASRYVETILMSDTNHAKDAQGVKIPSLVSLVSELILTLVTTPLGARLTTQAADFVMRSAEATMTGEPRFATSSGLSTIVLGRDRLGTFGELSLATAFLQRFLTPVEPSTIRQWAQAFLIQQRLLAGQGQQDLLDRLLEQEVTASSSLNVPRLLAVIDQYAQELVDTALLTHAASHAHLAFQQVLQPCDDLKTVFAEREANLVQRCLAELEQLVRDTIQDPDRGLVTTRLFLEILADFLERIRVEAGEENPLFDDELNQAQERVESFQAQVPLYLQQIEQQRRSLSYQLFARRQIETRIAAELQQWTRAYLDGLKRYYVALIRRAAHHASLETLGHLQKGARQVLAQIQQAERTAADVFTQLSSELQRVAQYRPEFECPNGLCLISTEAELKAYYARILPEEGENRAIAQLMHHLMHPLLQHSQLLPFLSNPIELKAQLLNHAQSILDSKLSSLHVVSELQRRFPTEQALGQALRQRDRQSFEFIQLKGNCDKENGVFVVRLLGIDQAQAGNLPTLLNQYSSRGTPYEVMDTGDADKIIFLQHRTVFPYSDWAHYAMALDDYEHISAATQFEKFHPVVGARNLPLPGQIPVLAQAEIAVIYSWMLERIQRHPNQPGYLLYAAHQAISLEQCRAVLCSKKGYACLVDLISQFNCLYQSCPTKINDALNRLRAVRECLVEPIDPIELAVSAFLQDDIERLLVQQLDWWRSNTIAAAMESEA